MSERAMGAEAGPYSRHLPALDGVRGLAVLGVIATHVFSGNAQTFVERSLAGLVRFGASGVDLFFVLSGMLITGILFDSLGERQYFRKFYMRRALRIFPLYYAVLLGFGLTIVFLGKHYGREILSFALYLQNTDWVAPRMLKYHGPSMLPLDHFWTLAIEEQFYLFWPLLVFLIRDRGRLLVVCCVGILVSPVLRVLLLLHNGDFGVANTNTLCRMDSLLAGAALALLLRGSAHDRVLRTGWWLLGAGALVEAVCLLHVGSGSDVVTQRLLYTANYTALAVASVGLVVVCLRRGGAMERVFSLPPMRWLGRYSYGIYVLHMILRGLMLRPTKVFLLSHGLQSKGAAVILSGFLIIAATLLAAWVSYHVWEVRFLRLKRFFAYDKSASRAVATVGATEAQ